MRLFDLVYPCLTMFGPVCTNQLLLNLLKQFTRYWPCLASFGSNWPPVGLCLAQIDSVCPHLARFGSFELYLLSVWPCLFQYGPNLAQFGPVCPHLTPWYSYAMFCKVLPLWPIDPIQVCLAEIDLFGFV